MGAPIPCRLTFRDGTTVTRFASVENFEHATLCRAFELDQASFSFDLPRSAYSTDAYARRDRISGYVLRCGQIVGTLHVAREGEQFRDLDVRDERDRLSLEQTR